MLGSRSKDESLAPRGIGLSAGGFAVCLTAVTLAAGTARTEPSNAIPQFASANFGWQSNLEDWEDPPPGAGHGPIKNDPAYPFLNNAEGTRAGTGATKRITNTKDPVLKPWAAAQIQATNEEILQGRARHSIYGAGALLSGRRSGPAAYGRSSPSISSRTPTRCG